MERGGRNGERKMRGGERRAGEAEMNLTHHDALNIPPTSGCSDRETQTFSPPQKKNPNVFNPPSKESLLSNYQHIVGERKWELAAKHFLRLSIQK